jgi:hypothetical protein
VFLPTTSNVLDDETSESPSFAHSRAIPEEKASTYGGRLSFPSFRSRNRRSDRPDISFEIIRIHWHILGDYIEDNFLLIDGATRSVRWQKLGWKIPHVTLATINYGFQLKIG